MRHTLRLHDTVVGYSELEHIDPGTGRAWGSFRPDLGYEIVQPVFQLFAIAIPRGGSKSTKDDALLERYYKARDALRLDLCDAHGRGIRTSAIHIADYTIEEGSDALELDVLISDDSYWRRRLGT
jgi:hypothetical protein